MKDSPDSRAKDVMLPRPISTLTSNRESVTSKDKLLSARVGMKETAVNFNLPLTRKQTSETRLVVDLPRLLGNSDTQENPVRIGPKDSSDVLGSDGSDLNSPAPNSAVKISMSPKPSEKLKSKEKLASIVAKNTESKKKLSTDLSMVLEKHRKSEGGLTTLKHERLNSGISQKDTPRVMQGLEDSIESFIDTLREKKKSLELVDKDKEQSNPFSITQSLKKKAKQGVVVLGKSKTQANNKTAVKVIPEEKIVVPKIDESPEKKQSGMYIDLYKEEGAKHYVPMPNFKNSKAYDSILHDKRNNSQNLNTSNPSSNRLQSKSNDRSQKGNAFKSASLQFSSSTKKPTASSPSYSSSIYN